jgi:hypothetical protein
MRHMHALPDSFNDQCLLTTNLVTCEMVILAQSSSFLLAILLGLAPRPRNLCPLLQTGPLDLAKPILRTSRIVQAANRRGEGCSALETTYAPAQMTGNASKVTGKDCQGMPRHSLDRNYST